MINRKQLGTLQISAGKVTVAYSCRYTPWDFLHCLYVDRNLSKQDQKRRSDVYGNPVYPAHKTQTACLLAVFLRGFSIDSATAFRVFKIVNLRAAVSSLRKLGWSIETWPTLGSPANGYHLSVDTLNQLGDKDREFADLVLAMAVYFKRVKSWQ